MADRARNWERQVRLNAGVTSLAERFIDQHGSTVLAGPFAGLTYDRERIADVDAPVAKLLGSYEQELHPAIREGIQQAPATFIDLGCAEGYYAVGFARASPATTVFAFDLSRSARNLCRALALSNDVAERLHIRGGATSQSLDGLPLDGSVVLSDCEGAEIDIFTPAVISRLGSALVIIELHEWIKPGCGALLEERLSATHMCDVVPAKPRDPTHYSLLKNFSVEERALAISEWRDPRPSKWAVFRPKFGWETR